MALFTADELADYLGRALDTDRATLARDLATGLVLDVTGPLEQSTVTVVLPIEVDDAGYRCVRLPSSVVTAVSAVVVDGVTLTATDDWEWLRPQPLVRLYSYAWTSDARHQVATVTATIGYASGKVPPVAKAVALSAAARAYDNPTGARSESIDDYSVTRAGSDADLAGLTLTDAERAALAHLATAAYVTGSGA